MINIIYTTKTTKAQYKFNLCTGHSRFESAIRKSSIVREIRDFNYGSGVSLQKYIDKGVDISFEGTTPVDTAIIKLLPYDKTTFEISQIYSYLVQLEEKNKSLYAIIETNLLFGKYKDIYELYDYIRNQYKNSAASKLSLYSPMIGILCPLQCNLGNVSEKTLYENIEKIEAAIQYKFGVRVVHCNIEYNGVKNVVAAEYHADLVKTRPFLRLDIYFNKKFTQQEIDEFKAKYFEDSLRMSIETSLPELVRIESTDSVLTTEEMNKAYFNN